MATTTMTTTTMIVIMAELAQSTMRLPKLQTALLPIVV
jgi:hypothetical protein